MATTIDIPLNAPETPQNPPEGTEGHKPAEKPGEKPTELPEGQDTFPREYVEQLRTENASYRTRAKDRDALAERLVTALVEKTGRLADPSDLPFKDEYVTDENALNDAIEDLIARKPHLASRKPKGDVGQGRSNGHQEAPAGLGGLLKSLA